MVDPATRLPSPAVACGEESTIVARMKVRDSGMPEQSYWESLFDVGLILDRLKVNKQVGDVVEVGCGYGTFTLPVARRIQGTVRTFDIDPEMIEITQQRAKETQVANLSLVLGDVVADGFGLPAASVDAALLFNILHAEKPLELLRVTAEVVRPGGRILAIHWRSDITTPRGPDLAIRPRPEQIADWARSIDLVPEDSLLLPPWHFGLILGR